jgi:hypothetical protein
MIKLEGYIRLSPTSLFLAPSCYGEWKEKCTQTTAICSVGSQCMARQPIELINVEHENRKRPRRVYESVKDTDSKKSPGRIEG